MYGRFALIKKKSTQEEAGKTRLRDLKSHNERPHLLELSVLMRLHELQPNPYRCRVVCCHWAVVHLLSLRAPHRPRWRCFATEQPQKLAPKHRTAMQQAVRGLADGALITDKVEKHTRSSGRTHFKPAGYEPAEIQGGAGDNLGIVLSAYGACLAIAALPA
jgi:hypothetical protein